MRRAAATSAWRTAKPSIADTSQGGWSRLACTSSASTRPSANSAPQQLLRFADASLYAAKRAGRNRVSLNSDCPA